MHPTKETPTTPKATMNYLRAALAFLLCLFNARAIQREDEDREEND